MDGALVSDFDDHVGYVTTEEAKVLLDRYHAAVTKDPERGPLMSIPVDFKRDADVRLYSFIRQVSSERRRLVVAESKIERVRALLEGWPGGGDLCRRDVLSILDGDS